MHVFHFELTLYVILDRVGKDFIVRTESDAKYLQWKHDIQKQDIIFLAEERRLPSLHALVTTVLTIILQLSHRQKVYSFGPNRWTFRLCDPCRDRKSTQEKM